MKVQELFEAKEVDPNLSQKRFERDVMMPAIKQLLGSDQVKTMDDPGDEDLYKPKKTKHLVWHDTDGLEGRYDLYLLNIDGQPVVRMEYNDEGGGCEPFFWTVKTKKAKKVTEAAAPAPSALRAAIKKHLKAMGFKAVSEETTSGAMKTWFDQPAGKVPAMRTIFISLKKEFPDQHVMFSGGKVMGDGFNLEPENEGDGIYLAVFNKGSAGQHHKMGVDN